MPIPPDVARDIETLKRAISEHRSVATPLGVFGVRTYAGYASSNPRTGASIAVPSKHVPYLDVDEQLALAVLGAPSTPRPPERAHAFRVSAIDPGTGETLASSRAQVPADDLGEAADGPPAVTLTCAALHADVLATLAAKGEANYSGFGKFVRTARPTRLEFTPSQVWKSELADHR